jgi:hypothetical protein
MEMFTGAQEQSAESGRTGRVQKLLGQEEGAMGYILLWALGIPIPILFLIFLMRGCN